MSYLSRKKRRLWNQLQENQVVRDKYEVIISQLKNEFLHEIVRGKLIEAYLNNEIDAFNASELIEIDVLYSNLKMPELSEFDGFSEYIIKLYKEWIANGKHVRVYEKLEVVKLPRLEMINMYEELWDWIKNEYVDTSYSFKTYYDFVIEEIENLIYEKFYEINGLSERNDITDFIWEEIHENFLFEKSLDLSIKILDRTLNTFTSDIERT